MKRSTKFKESKRLRTLSIILCIMMVMTCAFSSSVFSAEFEEKSNDIVILYENDAHCAIEGYSKLSALKNELLKEYEYVGAVSSGDFLQGSTMGTISRGMYIADIINMVGYDALALGNHEFDYKIERLAEISDVLNTKPVCCNLKKLTESDSVFEPYVIKSYGETDVAYIGITTPDTLTSSSPSQFMDENGNYIYSFSGNDLSKTVQKAIDDAKSAGAEYVIGLSHLGTESVYEKWSVQTLIKNTAGFDAVLDGHSHSTVESLMVNDKNGNAVTVSSTGTKFANIGKLTISDQGISTELIPCESLTQTDPAIDLYISQIEEEYSVMGNRVLGKSDVELVINDKNGNRIIRNQETNLGDFCADAFRLVTDSDIGVINGGGIRDSLNIGDVTFNDILSIYPYNNTVCVAEVTGEQILDFLELSVSMYPEENGSFQHVSGLTYTINAYIPSPVIYDENMAFKDVVGERRVSDVRILNKETGKYEPVDSSKTYTLASHNYLLLDHGSGATMFDGSKIISNSGMLDVELLEIYIKDYLGGVIGKEYSASQNRVTVVSKKPAETVTTPDKDNADTSQKSPLTGSNHTNITCVCAFSFLLLAISFYTIKKIKTTV